MSEIRPFRIHISDDDIADLHRRIRNARYPPAGPHNSQLSHGIPLDRVKELAEAWLQLDWRKQEARLNSVPHFRTILEDIDLHFVHQRSSHSDAIPLILCAGWPGGFHEFVDIVKTLCEPPEGKQAFHVVVPSMPGFTFTPPPPSTSWQMKDTARIYDQLMQRLGYTSYASQGGDWGSITARLLASHYPERCRACHLNFVPGIVPWPLSKLPLPPPWIIDWIPGLNAKQKRRVQASLNWEAKESGYTKIQGSKPATLSYGLNDSPIGLLAWIGEKFDHWQENGLLTTDIVLTSISLYWFTQSTGSSFGPYKDNPFFVDLIYDNYIKVPTAYSIFPSEMLISPAHYVARTCDLQWHREAERGGHFAAMEVPDLFVEHLRDAFIQLYRPTA